MKYEIFIVKSGNKSTVVVIFDTYISKLTQLIMTFSQATAYKDIRIPCKNKDLELRNKRLLYPTNAIPDSQYYRELKAFSDERKRIFNEISPVEASLHIPGRIIHLAHSTDSSGQYINEYTPWWASQSTQRLREIDLNVAVLVSSVFLYYIILPVDQELTLAFLQN